MSGAATFEAERGADGFRFRWPQFGYAIAVDQLHDGRYGLTAELLIQTTVVVASTGRPAHVFYGQVNLSKLDDRDKLAKALSGQDGLDRVPWRDMLEIVRVETVRTSRQGEPTRRLRDVPTAPQLHLIERMIPLGETSVLYGDGASGKSLQAAAAALAVAGGGPIGPYTPCFQGPVLVLDWETTAEEWADRLRRLSAGAGLAAIPEAIEYRAMWRPLVDDLPAVRREVARLGAELVVVDSITLAVGGEVTADSCVPFYNALRSLAGTTRLVVSHVSKATSQQERGVGDPYGSIFVKNFARSAWAVKRDEVETSDGFEAVLTHRKVNRGRLQKPVGVRLRFVDPDGPIELETVDAMARPGLAIHASIADQIRSALRQGAMSTKDLAEETSTPETVVSATARRLAKTGHIIRLDAHRGGRGKTATYGLPAFAEAGG